mmetsp:Transcript_27130/g.49844  ORF Transcript_27130/g.49844 Transcript_27130/m.49844 type:complete len:101 (-) Transcript_27130:176-478(-)
MMKMMTSGIHSAATPQRALAIGSVALWASRMARAQGAAPQVIAPTPSAQMMRPRSQGLCSHVCSSSCLQKVHADSYPKWRPHMVGTTYGGLLFLFMAGVQ